MVPSQKGHLVDYPYQFALLALAGSVLFSWALWFIYNAYTYLRKPW